MVVDDDWSASAGKNDSGKIRVKVMSPPREELCKKSGQPTA